MTMKNAVENFQKVAMNSGLTLKEGKKAVLDYAKVVCSSPSVVDNRVPTVLDQYFCPFCGNAYGSEDTKKCHICGTRRKK
ncbi:MAG: hypothetical protein IJ172_00045 [Ruminococcus sp.]|nr:hypothetical protein [Ruminococcus sp.]